MLTNKIFEFYALYIWPVLRLFVKRSKRCRLCILSEKYSPLIDGLCPECAKLASHVGKSSGAHHSSPALELSLIEKARFETVIHSYVNEKNYHALLLLSGGKDSAYILHRMKQDFPELKILCLIVNNGFMSPFAINAAKVLAEKMITDLLVVNDKIDEFARVLRRAFLELKGQGSYGVVDHADGTLIFKTAKQIANEMKIRLVISGLSWVQVQRIVGENSFEVVTPDEPHEVFPLAVWRTSEQDIRSYVRSHELLPPGSDSPLLSNSSLILSMAVIDILNLGYSSFEPEFAQLIRERKSDRRTWLHSFELLEFGTRYGILKKAAEANLRLLKLSLKDIVKETL